MYKNIFYFLTVFTVFLLVTHGSAQSNNYIQLGPEMNFTQADSANQQKTVKSLALSASVHQKLNDFFSVGIGYSFGRAWHRNQWANLHKYTVLATVISRSVTFSLLYEYIYVKLPDLKSSGSGLGVKVDLSPFKQLPHLSFFLSANVKNQALGINYLF